MWKFFKKYPTPEAASVADIEEIKNMISPLGLSERRSRALVRMSDDYINKDWEDAPAVLYGIGKYGSDAYRIFCVGDWRNVNPSDHAFK